MTDTAESEIRLSVSQIRELRMQMARMQTAKTQSLSHRLQIAASPKNVYKALLDSNLHTNLTGKPSKILPEFGGAASIADGFFHGFVLEAIDNRHIVFGLQSKIEGWPENHLSTATFMLRPGAQGPAKSAELVFMHQNVPVDAAEATAQWWKDNYWDKLPDNVSND